MLPDLEIIKKLEPVDINDTIMLYWLRCAGVTYHLILIVAPKFLIVT